MEKIIAVFYKLVWLLTNPPPPIVNVSRDELFSFRSILFSVKNTILELFFVICEAQRQSQRICGQCHVLR